ncbi:MAG: ImmA/IrrE family metallo-endopeptidase [Kofleriaceae bacterium]
MLLDRHGREYLDHLQIEALAQRLGVELVETRLDGQRAQLVVGQHGPRILLSDRQEDPDDRRWSIAHELGHYVLGHAARPVDELCTPRPEGWRAADPDEDAADSFASVLLMPAQHVAAFCDRTPMNFDVPMGLAETCGVSWEAAAMRIMETSWQVCAVAFSQHGRLQWIAPSMPFLMLCGNRLRPGRVVGPGALARRFFDTGMCPEDAEMVPASAWVAGCGPEAQIAEHSVANRAGGVVMTILWDPVDLGGPRPALATLPAVTAMRDYLLDRLDCEAAAKSRNQA